MKIEHMEIWVENLHPNLKADEERARGVVAKLLADEKMDRGDVSVVFVDDHHIRDLNRRYLHRDGPTDVLAFGMREGEDAQFAESTLGDVYVSLDRARQQAVEYGVTYQEEVLRLVIHGVLHILGHDHREEEEATNMKELEDSYLRWALEQRPSFPNSSGG